MEGDKTWNGEGIWKAPCAETEMDLETGGETEIEETELFKKKKGANKLKTEW